MSSRRNQLKQAEKATSINVLISILCFAGFLFLFGKQVKAQSGSFQKNSKLIILAQHNHTK